VCAWEILLSGRPWSQQAASDAAVKGRCIKIAKNEGPRINEEITSRTCRLIGVDGSQLGLFGVRDALRIANEQNMDLVEIAPNAEPPVCKVMDYRKYKYEQDRKAKAARKKQVRVEVKEMKFRPKIDVGDYETKKNHVLRFLRKGARVKITIMFRGREMAHPEQGRMVLDRLAEDLKPFATVEQAPKMEGRNMHMLVAPIKGAFDKEPADE
jgi:translation initiation factor IF-3